jgi:hypothetical protein
MNNRAKITVKALTKDAVSKQAQAT